jgi:hypothetical protein
MEQEVWWCFSQKKYLSSKSVKDISEPSISIILYFIPPPLLRRPNNVLKLYSITSFSSDDLDTIRRQSSVRGNAVEVDEEPSSLV